MKKLILTFVFLLTATVAIAQQKSSENIIAKTYDFKNFDKLTFTGFNDNINIKIGATYKVEIILNEGSQNDVVFDYVASENQLSIKLKPISGKKLYSNRDTFKVNIEMPEISVLKSTGNGDVNIQNIVGRYFRAESVGNGDVNCNGTIDTFDIEKSGNGNLNAKKLLAKSAKIKNTGNGDVVVNVSEKITATNVGNGDVKNYGQAKFDNTSKSIGNGALSNN